MFPSCLDHPLHCYSVPSTSQFFGCNGHLRLSYGHVLLFATTLCHTPWASSFTSPAASYLFFATTFPTHPPMLTRLVKGSLAVVRPSSAHSLLSSLILTIILAAIERLNNEHDGRGRRDRFLIVGSVVREPGRCALCTDSARHERCRDGWVRLDLTRPLRRLGPGRMPICLGYVGKGGELSLFVAS